MNVAELITRLIDNKVGLALARNVDGLSFYDMQQRIIRDNEVLAGCFEQIPLSVPNWCGVEFCVHEKLDRSKRCERDRNHKCLEDGRKYVAETHK